MIIFNISTNHSEAESSYSGANSHMSSLCAVNERTASKEGILCCVIVNDYYLYMARRSISFVLPWASAPSWNSFMALETRKEPNSAKWRAKRKGKKKLPSIDISIQRNEILNVFIIPSICSYFSLHTAIFPFSLLSYWHSVRGLERNLSFII